jgi:hypothetical protein
MQQVVVDASGIEYHRDIPGVWQGPLPDEIRAVYYLVNGERHDRAEADLSTWDKSELFDANFYIWTLQDATRAPAAAVGAAAEAKSDSAAARVAGMYDSLAGRRRQVLRDARARHGRAKRALIGYCRRVYDPACGQGGDLFKYVDKGATHIRGSDLSEKSVAEARLRWLEDRDGTRGDAEAKLYPHDMCAVDFDLTPDYDLVSIQFALHYAWENDDKLNGLLTNINSAAGAGCRVVLTFPDAEFIRGQQPELDYLNIQGFPPAPMGTGGAYTMAWGDSTNDTAQEYAVNRSLLIDMMKRHKFEVTEDENLWEFCRQKGLANNPTDNPLYTQVYRAMEFTKSDAHKVQPRADQATFRVLETWSSVQAHIKPASDAAKRTLYYLFFHMRAAIYVRVQNGAVTAFHPFANRKYRNNWPANPESIRRAEAEHARLRNDLAALKDQVQRLERDLRSTVKRKQNIESWLRKANDRSDAKRAQARADLQKAQRKLKPLTDKQEELHNLVQRDRWLQQQIQQRRRLESYASQRRPGMFEEFGRHLERMRKPREYSIPFEEWWANGVMVGNVRQPEAWGQSMFRELFAEVLRAVKGGLSDAEFFINKRDRPLLRSDRREPYLGIWPFGAPSVYERTNDWVRFCRHGNVDPQGEFATICSFYVNPSEHEDLHMPVLQDIALEPALGPDWDDRECRAVFRGSSTGPIEFNPRVALCNDAQRYPRIDAELTGNNTRLGFMRDGTVYFRGPSPRPPGSRLSQAQQRGYRYRIYVSGHSGGDRFSKDIVSGSTLFVMESHLPQVWLFYQLQEGMHYILVRNAHEIDQHMRAAEMDPRVKDAHRAMAGRARAEGMRLLREWRDKWWRDIKH